MSDMKSVLISNQPKWCELIAKLYKVLEVRRTRPKLEPPFKCYIYQTKRKWLYKLLDPLEDSTCNKTLTDGQGKVIGEFVCDYIEDFKKFDFEIDALRRHINLNGCMDYDEIISYLGNEKCGYGWHISNLKIYDTPKPLSDFKPWNRECKFSDLGLAIPKCEECHACRVVRPPQSWCYVEELNTELEK